MIYVKLGSRLNSTQAFAAPEKVLVYVYHLFYILLDVVERLVDDQNLIACRPGVADGKKQLPIRAA